MTAGRGIAGSSCPFCGKLIQPDVAVVVCPACNAAHHAECWQKKGGCSAFGCRGAAGVSAPQPTQQMPQPTQQMPQATQQMPQSGSCPKCGYVYGPMETTCRRCAAGVAPRTSQYQRPPYKSRSKSPAMIVVLCLLIVLAIAGAVSYIALNPKEGDIKLVYKFKQGQVNSYKFSMDMHAKTPQPMFEVMPKSMKMQLTASMSEKVLEVNEDGSARVETRISDIEITSPDMALGLIPSMPDQTFSNTISNCGRARDVADAAGSTSSFAMPGMSMPGMGQMGGSTTLPARGVDVGQTWTDTVPIPDTDSEITITSTLASADEILGGRKCCKIDQKYDGRLDLSEIQDAGPLGAMGASGDMTISGTGVIYFCRDEGRLVKNDAKLKTVLKMELGKQAASAGFPEVMEITTDMNVLQELTD